jgi:hypothetical protein
LDLRGHAHELDEAVALAEAFTDLVRDRAPDRLDPWLERAGGHRQVGGLLRRCGPSSWIG